MNAGEGALEPGAGELGREAGCAPTTELPIWLKSTDCRLRFWNSCWD